MVPLALGSTSSRPLHLKPHARLSGFGVQISELLALHKFVSAGCHAHFNAHKPPKTVAPTVFMLEK